MNWIAENIEWIFSGIGVSLLGLVGLFIKRRLDNNQPSQSINAGENSNNIQGGNDVNVIIGDKK